MQKQNRPWADLSHHVGDDVFRPTTQTIAAPNGPADTVQPTGLQFGSQENILDSNGRTEALDLCTRTEQYGRGIIQFPAHTCPRRTPKTSNRMSMRMVTNLMAPLDDLTNKIRP